MIATGVVTTLAGTGGSSGSTDATGSAARFAFPTGIWGDGLGNLYVADNSNARIRKVVISSGVVTTFAGTTNGSADGTGTAAQFSNPQDIWGDGTNLWVTDQNNKLIRKIVISSAAVTKAAGQTGDAGNIDGIGTAAKLSSVIAGLWGDGDSMYVAESREIRKLDSPPD